MNQLDWNASLETSDRNKHVLQVERQYSTSNTLLRFWQNVDI